MSLRAEPSRSHDSATRDSKPSHVKRLNFGRSILEADVDAERRRDRFPSRVIAIDRSVAGIPFTEKRDYVRKWIEENGERVPNDDDPSSHSSPVPGTSATDTCEGSPILGNSGKRSRERTRINRHAVSAVRSVGDAACQSLGNSAANYATEGGLDCVGDENKERQYLRETQCTPPSIERVFADGSPVLGARLYSYKRTRRKLRYGSEDCASPKRLKLRGDKIASTDKYLATVSDNRDNSRDNDPKEISVDESGEDSNDEFKETLFVIETEESPERSRILRGTFSSQEKMSSESGSSGSEDKKDNAKIETDTSNSSKNQECDKLSSTNSDNASLSNFIEEVDTQEVCSTAKASQLSVKSLLPSKRPLTSTQLVANDLNETYCSEAELIQHAGTQLSAKISLVPSLSKETTRSKSTQTAGISNVTTPSKVSPDEIMYARLLDSGKKRRKPKKGSMVAKLQSLINAQVSGVRIWHHRMNKKQDVASTRFISVLVRECTKRFGNQFLNGIVIEDRFNLLQSDEAIEQAESPNARVAPPRKVAYRDVTIILVCDIIGTLNFTSEVAIDVYPPWNILDEIDLTLEAMYISKSRNRETSDIINKYNSRKRERRIVKQFNCPCIEEQRELPFCARRPSAEKPDVMQRIFDF